MSGRRAARFALDTVVHAVPDHRRRAPTPAEWVKVGQLVSRMAAAGHDPVELRSRSFYLDLLLAMLCRERGVALVTADQDHDRIKLHLHHRTEPFPTP